MGIPRTGLALLGTLAFASGPLAAQQRIASPARPQPVVAGLGRLGPSVAQLRKESAAKDVSLAARLRLDEARTGSRAGHAVVGGLIGGAAGLLTCTVISNLVNDPGTGFSTCTRSGYLGFGLGGVAVGAIVGALIK
jgi:hypothetical protein